MTKKMLKLRLVTLVIALISVLFIIAAQDPPEFGTLEEVIVWMIEGGGSMVLAGYIIAYVLENIQAWHNLPVVVKKLVPWALAGIIGFIGRTVLVADLLAYIPPIIQSVLLMLIGWLFSQIAYKGVKEGSYGESTRGAAYGKPVASIPTPPAG